MSVTGEVVGIIACVAGIVSAYRDAGAIIQKIKTRRAEQRAPPPSRLLEESVDQAPEEIEREERRGVARSGRKFEEGDRVAVSALQQIKTQLQEQLLEKLRNAAVRDEATDFTLLVDESDLGRDRTITVLMELRQRLLLVQPGHEVTPLESKPLMVATTNEIPSHPPRSPESPPASQPLKHYKTWTIEHSNSRDASGEEDTVVGADEHQHAHRKRHSSILGFLKHHHTRSASHDNLPKVAEDAKHGSASPTSIPFRLSSHHGSKDDHHIDSTHHHGATANNPNFTHQEWEDDPAELWGAKTAAKDTVAHDGAASPPHHPTAGGRTTSYTSSIKPSIHHTSTMGSTLVPTPTPENDYLGFCKGAWKLQNGDRKGALHKFRDTSADVWSRTGYGKTHVTFLACAQSKCAFAGNINAEMIWSRIWKVEAQGIKMRWAFLAKSHVTQSKVKEQQFGYQCLFCVFSEGKSPVYFGTNTYLAHVSSTHRGQNMGDVVLYKCGAINDRVADDDEEFDINLYPSSEREETDRRKSEVLSDDLLYARAELEKKDSVDGAPTDSMFSANEPWNEGLSDFHWGGGLESKDWGE